MLGKMRLAVVLDSGRLFALSASSIRAVTAGTTGSDPSAGRATVTTSGVNDSTPRPAASFTARTQTRDKLSSLIRSGRLRIVGVLQMPKPCASDKPSAGDTHDAD